MEPLRRARLATPGPRRIAPLLLVERAPVVGNPEPKALVAYGLYLPAGEAVLPHFADGRPDGALTAQFLAWCCDWLAAAGEVALLLVRDNAGWRVSAEVRAWIRAHNRAVKCGEATVRLIACRLPVKSPWLNPSEPKWVHGKRRACSPDHMLAAHETAERACAALNCAYEPHLALSQQVP